MGLCMYKSKSFIFNAADRSIRTVMLEGQPYFVAKDICAILGISNHNDAVGRLDDDERRGSVLPTPSGEQMITLVNESGLYHLIFQRNSRVLAALYKRACENRKAERLYYAPRIMAERLLSK